MRVLMIVDMEGASGITTPRRSWVFNGTEDWERFGRDRITADVAAASRGALAGGAEGVSIIDFHNQRNSIRAESLPGGAVIARFDDYPVPLGGINRSHELLFLVGFHAKANAPGILAHTINDPIDDVRVNGRSVGEIGMFAGSCGTLGLRAVLVTGDRTACDEARSLSPGIVVAAVKERLADGTETTLPDEETAALISTRAQEAVREGQAVDPLDLGRPVRLEVALRRPELTDFALPPYFERVDERTLGAWTPDTYYAVTLVYALGPLYMTCYERLMEDDQRWWAGLKARYPSQVWESPELASAREQHGLTHWMGYWTGDRRRAMEQLLDRLAR
jgi:D-amino peptidase